jgi:hypothetical protein
MIDSLDFEARFSAALKSLDKKPAASLVDSELQSTVETSESDDNKNVIAKGAQVRHINLFQHPDAHPVALDLALLKKYGADWLTWETEVLSLRIVSDFPTTTVSDLNMNKIMAMKTLHYVDFFWTQWDAFHACVMPFNNLYPDFEILHPPSVAQMMVAVSVSKRVREDVAWSEEVKVFMEQACRFDGIFCPPAPLDFVDVAPEHDTVDRDDIQRKWPGVRSTGVAPEDNSVTSEQLRRMLRVHNYFRADTERLQTQLAWIKDD